MNNLKFPSINNFQKCIAEIKYKNEDNLDTNLSFQGTIKLHGTHGDIIYNKNDDTFYTQSRNRLLSLDKDNMGFCQYVSTIDKIKLKAIINNLLLKYPDAIFFVLNGEWCGGNIQKNVALNQLQKMFIVYNISMCINDIVINDLDYVKNIELPEHNLYNIFKFKTFNIEININNETDLLNKSIELNKLTDEVERECPVGKYFGVSGIGEGIVWICKTPGYQSSRFWFKTKGELHSVTKTKNNNHANINIEKVNSITEFVDRVLTDNRLEQGISYLREMNYIVDVSSISIFSNWVFNDVIKEELETLETNKLKKQDVDKKIKTIASKWFIVKIKNL